MFFNKEAVCDGIELSVMECDKFKAGVLGFSLSIPLSKADVSRSLILSGLLRRGSLKYPSMAALNRRLDELYGSYVEIKSTHHADTLSLNIVAELLDDRYIPDGTDVLGGVIEVISEVLLFPVYNQQGVGERLLEQEIRVASDNLRAEINNTRVYAVRRCSEIMRGENSNYPTVKELKELVAATTLEEVEATRKKLITSAKLEVFYIGSAKRSDIEKKLCTAFSSHRFANERRHSLASLLRREYFKEGSEKMPVFQSKLAMSFSSGICIAKDDDSCYAALMLNEIFGGSASSKLFVNVREKMSLCYYCSSSFSIYTGVITVSSGIEADKLQTVKAAIIEQLDEIKRGDFTDAELTAAKKSIVHAYRQLYDSPFDLQAFYNGRTLVGINDGIEETVEKLLKVTREDVIAVADRITFDAMFFVEGSSTAPMNEEDENE